MNEFLTKMKVLFDEYSVDTLTASDENFIIGYVDGEFVAKNSTIKGKFKD